VTLNQDKLGSTRIYDEGYLISLFKGANLYTLFHETGHVFFGEMERLIQSGAADEAMARDYETLRNWLGARSGEDLATDQKEQFAHGFETYLISTIPPMLNLVQWQSQNLHLRRSGVENETVL